MKKRVFVFFILIICGLTQQINAQDILEIEESEVTSKNSVKNVIKINPLSPIGGFGSYFYERKINSDISLQLGFLHGYGPLNFGDFFFDGDSWQTVAFTVAMKYYPSNNSPVGFYLSPFLRYQQKTALLPYIGTYIDKSTFEYDYLGSDVLYVDSDLQFLGGGGMLGYQWLLGKYFTLEMFGGIRFYRKIKNKISPEKKVELIGEPRNYLNSVNIRGGIALGFAF